MLGSVMKGFLKTPPPVALQAQASLQSPAQQAQVANAEPN